MNNSKNAKITPQQIQAIVAETIREELEKAGVTAKPKRTMVTVVEAAELLGVSKEMIYKMERDGNLRVIELSRTAAKRTIRVPMSEIERITEVRKPSQK